MVMSVPGCDRSSWGSGDAARGMGKVRAGDRVTVQPCHPTRSCIPGRCLGQGGVRGSCFQQAEGSRRQCPCGKQQIVLKSLGPPGSGEVPG
jgi:hypothetical protein